VKKMVFKLFQQRFYGMNKHVAVNRDLPLRHNEPYGTTKMMIEQILQDVYKADNTGVMALLALLQPPFVHTRVAGSEKNSLMHSQ